MFFSTLVYENMALKEIYNSFNTIHPIDKMAWDDLSSLFQYIDLNKNEYLVRNGERTQFIYLLLEGVVRVFYNKEGNEYNKTFFISGGFPTALTALLSNAPSNLDFQALTPCKLIKFSYSKYRELFTKHRCLESLLLAILEQKWIIKERHDIHMVTNDSMTNYMIFRDEFPGLESLIPQYHIASYLGITPIQLSRIRAQLAKKAN